MKKLFLFAIVVLGFSAASFGQVGSNVVNDATASATIIEKLVLTENTELNFGTMGASSLETEVTVDPSLAATRSGSADLIASLGATAGKFTVTGEPSTNFSIAFSNSTTLTGDGDPMTVDEFTASTGKTGVSTGTLGEVSFYVGATLTINANQVAGDYSGDYTVTVLYE